LSDFFIIIRHEIDTGMSLPKFTCKVGEEKKRENEKFNANFHVMA